MPRRALAELPSLGGTLCEKGEFCLISSSRCFSHTETIFKNAPLINVFYFCYKRHVILFYFHAKSVSGLIRLIRRFGWVVWVGLRLESVALDSLGRAETS